MSSFSVAPVHRHRIVIVTIEGSLSLDDVARLGSAQAGMVKRLGYRPGEFDALIDVSASPIQPVVVAEAIAALSKDENFLPARLAFAHGNAPVKMQVRRVNSDRHACFFAGQDEALTWLVDHPL